MSHALESVFEEVWAALGVDEALRPKALVQARTPNAILPF
mgnify:CR=1 FL=1